MDDNRIIDMYWQRDESAIAATSAKYGRYLSAISGNILLMREDAEECVSDTYMSAWNSIPPHRPALLRTFLGKITRNLSINRYKQLTAEKRGNGEINAVLDELAECVSGKENVEETVDMHLLADDINDFLKKLSYEKRCIFLRRYWYGDKISQIAVRYNLKDNNVAVILSRLRIKLREYLLERGYEL